MVAVIIKGAAPADDRRSSSRSAPVMLQAAVQADHADIQDGAVTSCFALLGWKSRRWFSFFDSSDSLCAVVVIDVEVALIRWPQKVVLAAMSKDEPQWSTVWSSVWRSESRLLSFAAHGAELQSMMPSRSANCSEKPLEQQESRL
jgi:hypothetical protein